MDYLSNILSFLSKKIKIKDEVGFKSFGYIFSNKLKYGPHNIVFGNYFILISIFD